MGAKAQTRGKKTNASGRRKQELHRRRQRRILAAGIIIILAAAVYLAASVFFMRHFFPRMVVNGISCSGKTAEQSGELFEQMASDYTLTLNERGGGQEELSGIAIGLEVDPGTSLEELLDEQNGFAWAVSLFRNAESEVTVDISYDQTALEQAVSALSCMDEAQMYDSEDTRLSEYTAGSGYTLIDEVYGTRVQESVLMDQLNEAILSLAGELDLETAGCYVEPVYTAESEAAQAMLAAANRYVNTTVTYVFGDNTEVIDGSVISQWILVADDLTVTLDAEQEAAFVSDLADTYDTKWKSRTLVSHSGTTVTVPAGGNYGWRVNQDETLSALQGYLEAGEDYTGEVVYFQTAAQYGENDYGSTYIEVSISAQHFWYYVDGVVVLESDFVSGDVAKGHDTPKGAYRIAYKARDQVLEGQGYSSPVSYWMPFVEGCGFHDASWRTQFGGTIYLKNGSHGCLNLPSWAAKQLYELIDAGTAVLIY
ncbi:MAG: L,D-transpeptidase/peptidoglycan binding protein [Lachnospiraceae bacterium]|nr:L,D-transpeptidase/peptidoglycan binding protein [Lachnospiraceae bacterium]